MRRSSAIRPLLAAAIFLALLAVPASAAAPAPSALPAISGTARAGQILSSTTGTFTGTAPLTYGRTWQRCDDTGANCAAIVGASAATYTLAAADVGKTIRVTVLATNVEGSASATSAPTAIVAPLAPPTNDAGGLPAGSGTAPDRQAPTATHRARAGGPAGARPPPPPAEDRRGGAAGVLGPGPRGAGPPAPRRRGGGPPADPLPPPVAALRHRRRRVFADRRRERHDAHADERRRRRHDAHRGHGPQRRRPGDRDLAADGRRRRRAAAEQRRAGGHRQRAPGPDAHLLHPPNLD